MGKLFVGDCLNIMPKLEVGSIDMILCDLPYGTTACAWDSVISFERLWAQYRRVLKPSGVIVLSASQPFTTKVVASNFEWFRYEWIWRKNIATGHPSVKLRPMKQHENILVFAPKQPKYYPQMLPGKPYKRKRKAKDDSGSNYQLGMLRTDTVNEGTRYPVSVLDVAREVGLHPTQKPVPLWEYLVRTYTDEGDTVLDNCCGSGTTGVACQNLKRNFILIEQDLEYAKIAQKRLIDNAARLKLEQEI
jgi:site-specific DNA-methyltransferase (adenine-specific)